MQGSTHVHIAHLSEWLSGCTSRMPHTRSRAPVPVPVSLWVSSYATLHTTAAWPPSKKIKLSAVPLSQLWTLALAVLVYRLSDNTNISTRSLPDRVLDFFLLLHLSRSLDSPPVSFQSASDPPATHTPNRETATHFLFIQPRSFCDNITNMYIKLSSAAAVAFAAIASAQTFSDCNPLNVDPSSE